MEKALRYGNCICRTIMETYCPASKLRHEGRFNYHQGVFLSGMEKFNRFAQNEEYFNYAKDWADSILRNADSIHKLRKTVLNTGNLDDLQPGIILFNIYEKTGDEFYKRVLDEIIEVFDTYKCNKYGGFWHMENLPDQMWLDGLYMAGPLLSQYAEKYNCPELYDKVVLQAKLMYEHCFVPEKGLMKHGWDCEKKAAWADKKTGTSPEFWGRAFGWFCVALTDILECLPKDYKDRTYLTDMLKTLLTNVVRYQDKKSGLWYQILDKGDMADNFLETSCSMMFSTALLRAIKKGYLSEEYLPYAERGAEGVFNNVEINGDNAVLKGTCRGTMIGSYEYYVSRDCRDNDLHGCGAFLLLMEAVLR